MKDSQVFAVMFTAFAIASAFASFPGNVVMSVFAAFSFLGMQIRDRQEKQADHVDEPQKSSA